MAGSFSLTMKPTTITRRAGRQRIRNAATRLNHAKLTRWKNCTTMITGKIFMLEAWNPESNKCNGISWDGVLAAHGANKQRDRAASEDR